MNITRFIVLLLAVGFLSKDSIASADTASVRNEIRASASTGGNTAKEGQVVEGKAEAELFLETTVNGETVERIEEHIVSEDGEPVEIHKELIFESEDGKVRTESEILLEAQSGQSSEQGGADQEQNGPGKEQEAGSVSEQAPSIDETRDVTVSRTPAPSLLHTFIRNVLAYVESIFKFFTL